MPGYWALISGEQVKPINEMIIKQIADILIPELKYFIISFIF
jgi:hypothetical protein